ncbi:hypothetical protein GCM10027285_13890 [Oleiagrimonas citrea]
MASMAMQDAIISLSRNLDGPWPVPSDRNGMEVATSYEYHLAERGPGRCDVAPAGEFAQWNGVSKRSWIDWSRRVALSN